VGRIVGNAEGAVGFKEGWAVKVGVAEGDNDGKTEGRLVGAIVGVLDGTGPDNSGPKDDVKYDIIFVSTVW